MSLASILHLIYHGHPCFVITLPSDLSIQACGCIIANVSHLSLSVLIQSTRSVQENRLVLPQPSVCDGSLSPMLTQVRLCTWHCLLQILYPGTFCVNVQSLGGAVVELIGIVYSWIFKMKTTVSMVQSRSEALPKGTITGVCPGHVTCKLKGVFEFEVMN